MNDVLRNLSDAERKGFKLGFWFLLLALIFNAAIGGWSIDYLLWSFNGNNVHWGVDCAIGLFTAEVTVPLAVVIATLYNLNAISLPASGGG